MKTRVSVSGRIVLCGLVAIVVALVLARLPRIGAQGRVQQGYTVILAEQTTDKNGNHRLASLQTWATRADGATVVKLGPEGRGSRTIRLPSGILIEASDHSEQRLPCKFRLRRLTVIPMPLAGRMIPANGLSLRNC